MWAIILAIILAILHVTYSLCKQSIKTKKEATKRTLEYVCPNCGRTIPRYNIVNLGNNMCFYVCSSCGNSANIKLSKLQRFKDDIVDKIPNKDSIKDWDLSSAKDVEFTKVTETFNRKSDLD